MLDIIGLSEKKSKLRDNPDYGYACVGLSQLLNEVRGTNLWLA